MGDPVIYDTRGLEMKWLYISFIAVYVVDQSTQSVVNMNMNWWINKCLRMCVGGATTAMRLSIPSWRSFWHRGLRAVISLSILSFDALMDDTIHLGQLISRWWVGWEWNLSSRVDWSVTANDLEVKSVERRTFRWPRVGFSLIQRTLLNNRMVGHCRDREFGFSYGGCCSGLLN